MPLETGGDAQAQALVAANSAFYAAFRKADLAAMIALWSEAFPISCIHPGWPLLDQREAVLESWRGILGGGGEPAIEFRRSAVQVAGEAGYVLGYEALDGHLAAAINLFRREQGTWRLVHHQAGVCAIETAAKANATLQ
jgi:ketosteroid isomerase-like protein